MTKTEFEKILHTTLCCVYGMGLPRDAGWLAGAERVHRSTMLRRLRVLEQRGLVSCTLDGTTSFWTTTEAGHQQVLESMKRKPKTRARVRWDVEFMGYVAWVSTDGKLWCRGSPECRTQEQAADHAKKKHGVRDADITFDAKAPASQRPIAVR